MWSCNDALRLALAVVIVVLAVIGGVVLIISLVSIAVPPTEEQESIQKEGVERMDALQFDCYRRIGVFRDNKRNVTCWIDLNNGGISCIPNNMLTP